MVYRALTETRTDSPLAPDRLRQVDIKAEQSERQVQSAEQERDQWERKYEEAEERYRQSKKELDEVVQQMESL